LCPDCASGVQVVRITVRTSDWLHVGLETGEAEATFYPGDARAWVYCQKTRYTPWPGYAPLRVVPLMPEFWEWELV
jgi:hypothetical protein